MLTNLILAAIQSSVLLPISQMRKMSQRCGISIWLVALLANDKNQDLTYATCPKGFLHPRHSNQHEHCSAAVWQSRVPGCAPALKQRLRTNKSPSNGKAHSGWRGSATVPCRLNHHSFKCSPTLLSLPASLHIPDFPPSPAGLRWGSSEWVSGAW